MHILHRADDAWAGAEPPSLTFSPRVTMGGILFSGVAAIGKTLSGYRAGTLDSYNAVIGMTKVDSWK